MATHLMSFIFIILLSPSLWSADVYLIRHAQTVPGYGDPKGFDITKCETQRNLSQEGKIQAKRIKEYFDKNKIENLLVFSSPWCRCKDTAQIAFGSYTVLEELGSPLGKNWKKEFTDVLKQKIQNHDSNEVLVFVTHHFVIENLLNIIPAQGEIIIVDSKTLKIKNRIRI